MNDCFHGNVEADPILPKEWGGCLGLRGKKIRSLNLRDWTRQGIPRLTMKETILSTATCKLLYICEKNSLEHG